MMKKQMMMRKLMKMRSEMKKEMCVMARAVVMA